MALYLLYHQEVKVAELLFDDFSGVLLNINKVYSEDHLPIRAKKSKRDFCSWWADRSVPNIRSKEVCPNTSPLLFLLDNLGLSLSDSYWVKPINSDYTWKTVNLYSNSFISSLLDPKSVLPNDITSEGKFSPMASTGGELPKWWIEKNDKRFLIKGNSLGTSIQSRNEVFSTEINKAQDSFLFVPYSLIDFSYRGREITGCICPSFTSQNIEFVSAWELVERVNYAKEEPFRENFIAICVQNGLKEESVIAFLDYMALTDFVMSNRDRHLNNFGIVRDPFSLKFLGLAPLFDYGNSMMNNDLERLSFFASLKEPTNGFYSSYERSLNHVLNKDILDIKKLPSSSVIDTIYGGSKLLLNIIPMIKEVYETRVEYLKAFQKGFPPYNIKQDFLSLKKEFRELTFENLLKLKSI